MALTGATPAAWAHWDCWLGLGAHLLPVVCESGLPISPSSMLRDYGKVPSRLDREGRVVGFPKWTQHVTTDAEITQWSADPRLGICLQTRTVRALDVDIPDWDLASEVRDLLDIWSARCGVDLSFRTRSNSTKFLCLFTVPEVPEMGKSVLPVAHGMIECLADGNQCVIAGTHPSGVRYEWEGGPPAAIPALTLHDWGTLRTGLREAFGTADWSEGRLRKTRGVGVMTPVDDPVVGFLHEKGWVRA